MINNLGLQEEEIFPFSLNLRSIYVTAVKHAHSKNTHTYYTNIK